MYIVTPGIRATDIYFTDFSSLNRGTNSLLYRSDNVYGKTRIPSINSYLRTLTALAQINAPFVYQRRILNDGKNPNTFTRSPYGALVVNCFHRWWSEIC